MLKQKLQALVGKKISIVVESRVTTPTVTGILKQVAGNIITVTTIAGHDIAVTAGSIRTLKDSSGKRLYGA